MAPPKSPTRPAPQPPAYRQYPPRPPAGPLEIVDPIWLLKAIVVTVVAALVCGYISLCFLLYQGQWQLILHPQRTDSHPATLAGTPVEFLRFGPDESGIPQRTAWAIPAAPGARYARLTLLFLPAGDGSLATAQPTLTLLHNLGVNLFAIDYRGYGQSPAVHPSQVSMTKDADAAWRYLITSRGIAARQIVVYGNGIGASLAAQLAAEHPEIAAIILDTPAPDPLTTVLADQRTRLLPVRLLLHDRFPLAEPLRTLKQPRLLLGPDPVGPAYAQAADPKVTVALPQPRSDTLYTQAVASFLDRYLSGSQLLP